MTTSEKLYDHIRHAKAADLKLVVAVLETVLEIESRVARIEAADRDRETVLAASKSVQKAISHEQQN